ncbi:hypothetical protein M422DRAFT_264971 [Sphaerobolus stellatus SS14]|uniref:Integrase zinc-binding domain-containing protein n=1 Tax=Sphaerobolus stellatus (strain SS14) TaxID=990650 RepID=A0A0C9V6J5_SPHS4|nr:hypothetical protein M422DRAFT_264971 [Sphaerobolus stellatus SS14]
MSPRNPGGSDSGEDIDDVLAIKSGTDGVPLNVRVKAYMDLKQVCIPAYINDTLCVRVLQNVKAHLHFVLKGDLLWTKNGLGYSVACVLRNILWRGRKISQVLIDQAHQTIGHFGPFKTLKYIQGSF